MTKIILVRHCEAQGNHERVFQGATDCDITERGERQLEALSERFRTVEFDALYSSPLLRARRTAEAVNRHHGLPMAIEPGLREINAGHWEGKKWADFPRLYPDEARDWNLSPWNFAPEGGETMRQVYERITGTILDLAERERGRTVAAVSHGCAIRNLLCFAHGWPIERLNEVEWCDNTAVSVLEVENDGTIRILLENDSSHLSEELSTFARQEWWKKENREALNFGE